jgi:trigger factor
MPPLIFRQCRIKEYRPVKTDVEELSPTRVRLTIEVPFEELKPNLDQAYKKVAQQVQVPGFRRGKVPPRIIDQRFGRGVVLEEAINDAVPQLYGKAIEENEVFALGQPELEVTKLEDNDELAFTAEVDIRPKFDVPDYDGLPVTVDSAEVSDEDIDSQLDMLRERFAALTGADRPAETGDFASIDLSAAIDGEDLEDIRASGVSYEIGAGESQLEGLDDAIVGMPAGETKTFTTKLVGGDHEGEDAEVTVVVHSVKVKELPELDDEFAQSASEFDTLDELRDDLRNRLSESKKNQQVMQARDKALEALLEKVEIPLPDSVVEAEVERRKENLDQQLQMMGMTREAYLGTQEKSEEDFETETADEARDAVKAGFVLDQLALTEKLGVDEQELTEYVVQQSMRMGVSPDQLARHLTESGQISVAVTEVLRAKAMNLVVEHVKVTDEDGNEVDVKSALGITEDDEAADAAVDEAAAEAVSEEPEDESGEAEPAKA